MTKSHPVSVRPWGLLSSLRKMSNFQKLSGLRPKNKFFTKETTKSAGDDMKIQQGELINILKVYTVDSRYPNFQEDQETI